MVIVGVVTTLLCQIELYVSFRHLNLIFKVK